MMLADMGAEVLQMVSSFRPDLAAFVPPCLPGTNISCATAALGWVPARLHTREVVGELLYRADEFDDFEKTRLSS
jgi:hypothetical protein